MSCPISCHERLAKYNGGQLMMYEYMIYGVADKSLRVVKNDLEKALKIQFEYRESSY